MKPQRFEVGQAITLIKHTKHWKCNPLVSHLLPKFGEIYHVQKYLFYSTNMNCWKISLMEIDGINCNEEAFAPVVDDTVLESDLNKIHEPVTI